MSSEPHRDLPPSAFEGVTPPSRELTLWRDEPASAGFAIAWPATWPSVKPLAAYALGALVLLGGGFALASIATAPSLTDGVEEVTAIDARHMGLAANLDASGTEKRTAAMNRDLGALKNEISRLQKALAQAKTEQANLTKSTAGQAAANQDEVRALKTEIATLTRTLGETRDVSTAKIDALQTKVDQTKQDEAHVAELRERLDKLEKTNAEPAAARRDDGPDTTGSVAKAAPVAPPDRGRARRERPGPRPREVDRASVRRMGRPHRPRRDPSALNSGSGLRASRRAAALLSMRTVFTNREPRGGERLEARSAPRAGLLL